MTTTQQDNGATRLRTLGLSVPVSEVLDPQLWRERYAYGITLGPDPEAAAAASLSDALCSVNGGSADDVQAKLKDAISEIPDDVIRWHLRAAMSELEVKLGIPLGIVICKADPVDPG
ncbi:MAG: hypothetical protein ACYS5V_13180, partial [Planctomycetota bacterium]